MQEILPYPFINGRHEDRHLSPKQEEIFHWNHKTQFSIHIYNIYNIYNIYQYLSIFP
jgi:hypothetical protein